MTPKEKAKELVDKMYLVTKEDGIYGDLFIAKQCALVSIGFALEFITGDLTESFDKTLYLFEVKQEIENYEYKQ